MLNLNSPAIFNVKCLLGNSHEYLS